MGSELNSAELEVLESKFDAFLNLTIVGASRDYYNKEKLHNVREITALDDYNLEEGVKNKIEMESSKFDSYDEFGYKCQYINVQKMENKNVQKLQLCKLSRFVF